MGEYGAVGSQGSNAGGGGGGGGENLFAELTRSVGSTLSYLVDRILALPPEILLVLFAVMLFGGLMVFRRV